MYGRQRVLGGIAWHQRVDDREHVGGGLRRQRRGELVEVGGHREELVLDRRIRVFRVPLGHEFLGIVVVRRVAVLPPCKRRFLGQSRAAGKRCRGGEREREQA